MKNLKTHLLSLLLLTGTSNASAIDMGESTLWKGWNAQIGIDMSLQNPYGHNFTDVFPNGKTFGIDLALEKQFTRILNLRGRFNWENGIALHKNKHDNWLAPFYQPGENQRKGGYIVIAGDILFNIHELIAGHDDERKWNLQLYPCAGAVYNFGVKKGSPMVGFGILNSYKINHRYSIYGDISYAMVSSGFVGVEKSTGTGSNNNGFFNIGIGTKITIGKDDSPGIPSDKNEDGKAYWFLQAGADMTLINPYGANFSHVFPNGKSFGITFAGGRWFSPEIGLRARFKMENNIIKNGHYKWMGPLDPETGLSTNYDGGGFMVLNGDVLLSASNLIGGYNPNRKWDIQVFPRAGLLFNHAVSSASPLVGVGAGTTYKINEHWKVYGDAAYQVSTSESFEANSGTGMTVSTGSNGFFDFEIGAQYDL